MAVVDSYELLVAQYPAVRYPAQVVPVGFTPPFALYFSNGIAWVPLPVGFGEPSTGGAGVPTDLSPVYVAIAGVSSSVAQHGANSNNPHVTTKAQVGLGNVDNTSDVNKPVSTAAAAAIAATTLPTPIAYTTVLPFNGSVDMGEHDMVADVVLTAAPTGAVRNGSVSAVFKGDGVHIVTFGSGFLPHEADSGFDLTVDVLNELLVNCVIAGSRKRYLYNWSHDSAHTPFDVTAPTFVSASIARGDPTHIRIVMSEPLDATHVPAASAFPVSGGKTVTAVAISGSTITLTVNTGYAVGATVTYGYVLPGSNLLQDLSGNLTNAAAGNSVTNLLSNDVVMRMDTISGSGGVTESGDALGWIYTGGSGTDPSVQQFADTLQPLLLNTNGKIRAQINLPVGPFVSLGPSTTATGTRTTDFNAYCVTGGIYPSGESSPLAPYTAGMWLEWERTGAPGSPVITLAYSPDGVTYTVIKTYDLPTSVALYMRGEFYSNGQAGPFFGVGVTP